MPTKRTKRVQRWKPGDRQGTIFYLSARWADQVLTRFCSHAEINAIVRDFLAPIPREEQETFTISVAIALYAENGGEKRKVLGRWNPGSPMSLERFTQECGSLAAEYKSVWPPTESVEIHEPEA